jgi:hypothetical protein
MTSFNTTAAMPYASGCPASFGASSFAWAPGPTARTAKKKQKKKKKNRTIIGQALLLHKCNVHSQHQSTTVPVLCSTAKYEIGITQLACGKCCTVGSDLLCRLTALQPSLSAVARGRVPYLYFCVEHVFRDNYCGIMIFPLPSRPL